MNIAHVLPRSIVLPLSSPNGRYGLVHALAIAQIRAGHKVTIYCHPSSNLSQDGIITIGIPSCHPADAYTNNRATFAFALKMKHDVYHSHFDSLHYDVEALAHQPIVFTQHWWPTQQVIKKAADSSAVYAVPPTKYMQEFDTKTGIRHFNYIHHGIDTNLFMPKIVKRNNRLLFVGRISREKDLDRAISLAIVTGKKLDIIGAIKQKNISYWEENEPKVDGEIIRYIGIKTPAELVYEYSTAAALLFTSHENEAFGMVMIEAQACGLPVITTRGGSRPELVQNTKTGYLCKTDDEFIDAITHGLEKIQEKDVVSFGRKFAISTMEKEYNSVYIKAIDHYRS